MSSYEGIMGYGQSAEDIIGAEPPSVSHPGVESTFDPAGQPQQRVAPNGGIGGVAIALGVVAIGALALFYFRGS